MSQKGRKAFDLFISGCISLLICVFSVGNVSGQKKPTEFNSRFDDKQICGTADKGLNGTEYCDFWNTYKTNRTNSDATSKERAKDARNELIKYTQGKVDRFYEENTNKKRRNRALLQTIFDVLEIGSAATIGIINGERAKEVIAIALTGFQGGRTSLNKNFDLLRTQILINKMRENRAQVLTRIVTNASKSVSNYSWLDAKNDLRQYLYAGTFSNALDSLATETGAAAQDAETTLRVVSGDIVILPEATALNAGQALNANQILDELKSKLGGDETARDAALATLKNILAQLAKDPGLKLDVEAGNISESTDGTAIITRIEKVRQKFASSGRADLARKINETIVFINMVQ